MFIMPASFAAVLELPPRKPRLGPQAEPMSLDSLPDFELPPSMLDMDLLPLVPSVKNVTVASRPAGKMVIEKVPSAPRMGPARNPVCDEPMDEFELPEAALSDDEFWLPDGGFGELRMEFAEDISSGDKACARVTEAEIRRSFLDRGRGLSGCSTACADWDLDSCASPDLGWGS